MAPKRTKRKLHDGRPYLRDNTRNPRCDVEALMRELKRLGFAK